jgi:hypothetical protein
MVDVTDPAILKLYNQVREDSDATNWYRTLSALSLIESLTCWEGACSAILPASRSFRLLEPARAGLFPYLFSFSICS